MKPDNGLTNSCEIYEPGSQKLFYKMLRKKYHPEREKKQQEMKFSN